MPLKILMQEKIHKAAVPKLNLGAKQTSKSKKLCHCQQVHSKCNQSSVLAVDQRSTAMDRRHLPANGTQNKRSK